MKNIIYLSFLAIAIQGVLSQTELKCYICQDCSNPVDSTEIKVCNEESLTAIPTTIGTTVPTTILPEETTPVEEETTPVGEETTSVPEETTSVPEETTPVPVETTTVGITTLAAESSDNEKYIPSVFSPRFARSVMRQDEEEDETEFICYSFNYQVDDRIVTDRGCARNVDKDIACDAANDYNEHTDCTICSENECNSGTFITASIFTLIISLASIIVLRLN